jgi:protein ImuB
MRIACLLVPDLPLRAELRANPDLCEEALVITDGTGSRAAILTVSARARAQGIREGSTLPQAHALSRDLVVRVASPVLERAARETLLDVALSLSPRAELTDRSSGLFASEGAVYVDASGIDALHDDERAFASVLLARAERAGLPGVVALASSRSTARLAARHLAHPSGDRLEASPNEAIQVLVAGQELAFLAPLPIDLLDPNDQTAEALTRFGIHRVDDLLRLPRRDLAARLGPEILDPVGRARGEQVETPLPAPKNQRLEEGFDLEAPIVSVEPLAFVFRGLLSRLVGRLQLRSLGCTSLRLEMTFENGGRENRRIGLASSTQDEHVLLRLLRLEIESNPPAAAIEGVVLSCEGVPLRREQLDFFRPRGPSPSELDQTLAELSALCGPERVGAPALLDDHRPDAFTLKPFTPRLPAPSSQNAKRGSRGGRGRRPVKQAHVPSMPSDMPSDTPSEVLATEASGKPGTHRAPGKVMDDSSRSRTPSEGPRLTLRAFRPPLHAEVRIEGGRPVFVRSAISQGEVLGSAGPWRTTGGWWSESAHFAVDHYDIQMMDGTVLRLCFDWKRKRWQIDGLYD